MAIQFACPSCRQPIEVDDEHGGQQVSCPYCRNVVAAPSESTLHIGSDATTTQAPGARPLSPPGAEVRQPPPSVQTPPTPEVSFGHQQPTGPIPQVPPMGLPAQPPRRNIVGIIGIACGLVALVLYLTTAFILVSHLDELGVARDGPVDQTQMQQRMMKLMEAPEQHPWVVTMLTCFAAAGIFWLAGLTCSVIGMSKRYRSHGFAVAGLIVALVLPLMACAGFALQ